MTADRATYRKEIEAIRALASTTHNPGEFCLKIGSRIAERLDASAFWFLLIDPASGLPLTLECDYFGDLLRAALSRYHLPPIAPRGTRSDLASELPEVEPRISVLRPAADNVLVEVASAQGAAVDVVAFVGVGGLPRGLLVLLRSRKEESRLKGNRRLLAEISPVVCRSLRHLLSSSMADSLPGSHEASLILGPDGELEAVSNSAKWFWPAENRRVEMLPLPIANMVGSVRCRLDGSSKITVANPTLLLLWVTGERYWVWSDLLEGSDGRLCGLIQIRPMRALDDTDNLLRLGLTHRESQVTQATLRGFTTRQAGYLLKVSKHTVEHHLSRVYERLSIRTRAELAALLLGG